ncbi:hypothetical protein [Amycolatopsis echigonensis]|uniref:Pyridoxamine 5'-phosphate oxidase-like protein n=1 Tax=Amycolatopsis echigonensis TaxID=2576905 RepID=A0A8E2B2Y4_9PSEU|nr:hypothetical protein [Amycolatopsis echigonensis]MBB2498558.1 hypothetical protein [Amycolatopsis echigonensis]
MDDVELTHRECVRLLRSPERGRHGIVAIDGLKPVPRVCLLLDAGDVLIPTGPDSGLVRVAALRPVSLEFTDRGKDGRLRWTVRGIGLARPMTGLDVPHPVPRSTVLAAMPDAFRNGVRVVVARYRGNRPADGVVIPAPRVG